MKQMLSVLVFGFLMFSWAWAQNDAADRHFRTGMLLVSATPATATDSIKSIYEIKRRARLFVDIVDSDGSNLLVYGGSRTCLGSLIDCRISCGLSDMSPYQRDLCYESCNEEYCACREWEVGYC